MAREWSPVTREIAAGVAYSIGGIGMLLSAMYAYLRMREIAEGVGIRDTRHLERTVQTVTDATKDVHAEVVRLAIETAHAQRLAVWVGVGTAVLGAILGGFAGAIAARVLGA